MMKTEILLRSSRNNVKKMFPLQKKLNLTELESYRLPIYNKKAKEKVVYFYVLDPQSVIDGNPKLVRIRKKFNHIHGARERDDAALRFRDEVSRKLRTGWNPLIQEQGTKGFTTIQDVLEKYERYLKKMLKDEVFTKDTHRDYSSRFDMFKQYLQISPIIYIYQLDTPFVESFLEWVYVDRDTSPRTRNNYRLWISTFCTFLKQSGYLKENPVEGIKNLREQDKFRKTLTAADLSRLHDFLDKNDKPFLLVCMMQYYTFIRPKELMLLRVGDISVKEQTVFVSHSFSKNRKDGKATLPARVIRLMIELGVLSHHSDCFLFSKGFMPGERQRDSRSITNRWKEVRKALGFPSCYQFYSLKDTGITDAIGTVGLTVAMDQARHSDISITNKYVAKDQLHAHPELKNFEGNL